jgi:hypothetical protein
MTSDEHNEHLKRTDRVLTAAYRFANGNVMAFDQFGQQMPEYQGQDAMQLIAQDYPTITIEHGTWR